MKKGINKKVLILPLFIFAVLAINLIAVSAAADDNWLEKRWNVWKLGEDALDGDEDKLGMIGDTLKYLVLALLVLLIYAALEFVDFPRNQGMRFIMALVVGFLATFFITTNELITLMQSYKAMGLAIGIFFPILILGFFSFVTASKADPIGIYLQKILWVIFSVYLFLRTGALILLKYAIQSGGSTDATAYVANLNNSVVSFLLPENVNNIVSTQNNLMLIILFVVSIAVFITMVLSNKPVIAWLTREKISSEVESQDARMRRSRAYDDARADAMEHKPRS